MPELNKTLRVRTAVGATTAPVVNVSLEQDFDTLEIMSLKLTQKDTYKLHNANYGVVVGRVIANGGFGVPNAKISVFIEGEFDDSITDEVASIYPYSSTRSKDGDGVRYNLLPDNKVDDCHQIVGTFPNKSYLLDNDVLIEVFDKYYKYTTRTNNSGDYIICGVPTGSQTIHMDLDLSDCGILSQRPRDFVYKGYTIEQFENPNQFKTGEDLDSLSQIFSQDKVVNVVPFWGNESLGETIGITRADIEISFKFEPTCVFMGCVVGDNASNGISKKCVPTNQMGAMDELTTGEGTIEMIRKTVGGDIEEFQVKGTQVIDGNGVWCYQIPMNLDYMMTDEYGNMVATDDPDKGIPTRTRVRFRVSMQDFETNTDNYFRAKVLVPHNPQDYVGADAGHEDYDYEFGSQTKDESFRDLFWNNVYTVKSYIPRFQKSQLAKTERFSGIKHCNIYGQNNPMPYNNIRIRLPFMFTLLCVLIKCYVRIVGIINSVISALGNALADLGNTGFSWPSHRIGIGKLTIIKAGAISFYPFKVLYEKAVSWRLTVLQEGLCPDLENWYFSPVTPNTLWKPCDDGQKPPAGYPCYDILDQTFSFLMGKARIQGSDGKMSVAYKSIDTSIDSSSIDERNVDEESVCLTINTDYLISCIEMNLAQEYKVINFDFYNDWVNGAIYMPRWMRIVKKKRSFLFGLIKRKAKIKACMDVSKIFGKTRRYTQQCALSYAIESSSKPFTTISTPNGCSAKEKSGNKVIQKCHKKQGKKHYFIFGSGKKNKTGNGGVVHEDETSQGQFVYYFKPCEWRVSNDKRVILFANDIVLLGSLNDCSLYGIPQAFKYLTSSSYIMPTNLALTNMDDDGYLYADGTGTICSTNKTLDSDEGLNQLDASFSATSTYYSTDNEDNLSYGNTKSDDSDTNYDDMVAITEAAGIAWNYTGPQQGTENPSKLYQPGGHFLGISCTNSQTNIKSCINLQRICEAGATMSQRREEVREVNKDGDSVVMKYTYFVPTGVITQDEINSKDFRSMFATMNHNRLLCTGGTYDEKTGYPIYDFIYMRPNGFNGGLKKRLGYEEFNKTLDKKEANDESYWMTKSGVTASDDYDSQENTHTERRTIEDTNNDYYMFRMGLNTLNPAEQKKRFLFSDSYAALPQYENSYYFYFGLKDGATALDEFTKQFFSTCESTSIVMNTPYIRVKYEVDTCELDAKNIRITGEFLTAPLTYVITDTVTEKIVANGTSLSNTIVIDSLDLGSYNIQLIDANESEVTKTIKIGDGIFGLDRSTHDFEFRTKGMSETEILTKDKTTNSGYLRIGTAFTIGDETYIMTGLTDTLGEVKLIIQIDGEEVTTAVKKDIDYVYIYLTKPDVEYDIYVQRTGATCKGSAYFASFTVNGIDNIDLYLGSKLLPYSTILKGYSYDWWNEASNMASNNDVIAWAKKHALFRQTDDDTDSFTNQVFGMNNTGKKIDTVLFGAPESIQKWMCASVTYEGDTEKLESLGDDYSLSDDSVIATWYDSNDAYGDKIRAPFSEMTVDNNRIVSDCIYVLNVTGFTTYTTTHTYYTFSPDTQLKGMLRQPYCEYGIIGKLENGTIIYPVYSYGMFICGGEPPIANEDIPSGGINISIYRTFVYPVMYRPFIAEGMFYDWVSDIATVEVVGEEVTPSTDDFRGWVGEVEVSNGITLKNGAELPETYGYNNGNRRFQDDGNSLSTASTINGLKSVPVRYYISSNAEVEDVYAPNGAFPKAVSFRYYDKDNKDDLETYTDDGQESFHIEEAYKESWDTTYPEINTPDKVSLETREGNVDVSSMPKELEYYAATGAASRGKYYADGRTSTSTEVKYYAISAANCECPIEASTYNYIEDPNISNKYYVEIKVNQDGVNKSKLNELGETSFATLEGPGIWTITFALYMSDDAEEQTKRIIPIATGGELNKTVLDAINKALKNNQYGVELVKAYELKKTDDDETIKVMPHQIENAISSAEEIKVNGKTYDLLDYENGDYVVGVVSGESGTKGFIKNYRIYIPVKAGSFSGTGEDPYIYLQFNGTDDDTFYIGDGGSTPSINVRTNTDEEWTVTLDGKGWCTYATGEDGTYTGKGSTQIQLKSDMSSTAGTENPTAVATIEPYSGEVSSHQYETVYISQKSAPKPTTKVFTVLPSSLTFDATGGSQSVSVTITGYTTTAWSLEENSDWVSTDKTAGAGNGTVTITVDANSGTDSRTTNIKFTGSGGEATAYVSITQSGTIAPTGGTGSYTIDASSFEDSLTAQTTAGGSAADSYTSVTVGTITLPTAATVKINLPTITLNNLQIGAVGKASYASADALLMIDGLSTTYIGSAQWEVESGSESGTKTMETSPYVVTNVEAGTHNISIRYEISVADNAGDFPTVDAKISCSKQTLTFEYIY